jgi:hypothetical protein
MIGRDSGGPVRRQDFQGDRGKVCNGLCLALAPSTAKPRIQLTAASAGLETGSVAIATSEAPKV